MKLKELRQLKGITQKQLSNELQLSPASYNNYEIGKREPDIKTLCKIADYFNVSLDYVCEHQTQHLIDTSSWSDTKRAVLKVIDQLSETNLVMVLGYTTHALYDQQKNSI